MQQAVLRLFNAIQLHERNLKGNSNEITIRTIRNGYVLDPAIIPTEQLLKTIESIVGISGEKANAAFHKSWQVVKNASMESLALQQVAHYITTYGFESQGIYHADSVYVPHEALDIPTIVEDIPLVYIRGMEAEELFKAIVNLASGVALSEQTVSDVMSIVEANRFDNSLADLVANRELKAMLYDYYGLVPRDPVEFLRHLISKLTSESLLIKNSVLIEKIKASNGKFLDVLIKEAPDDLASIFYRYKPIFLALKSISRNKSFFNRLRKDAVKQHKPLPEDFLNSVTAKIKHNELCFEKLQRSLQRASLFRKVRLAYALKHRMNAGKSIVYKVRNGRGWAEGFEWNDSLVDQTESALELVLNSLTDDLRPKLEGKTIYIPPGVEYTLPATEKQFTGHFPSGTSIEAPNDLIVGVHWTNTSKRVDLDLSVIGRSGKIGWDTSYRSGNRSVLFSGDMTDAPPPKGATELFYIRGGQKEAKILMLNFFNYLAGDEVEAKIIVANEKPKKFSQNYMVDPNNIIASATIKVNQKQSVLGLVAPMGDSNRVYFANVGLGTSISSSSNEHSTHAREFLVSSLLDSIGLEQILIRAGALVSDVKDGSEDIDLSPEKLNKSTIIDLLK